MGVRWNVADIQVFDTMANSLRQSADGLNAIKGEVDSAYLRTIDRCHDAISELKRRIDRLEFEIAQLEQERAQLQQENAAISCAYIDAEIRRKRREIRQLTEHLSRIERIRDDLVDTKLRYDSVFSDKAGSYTDEVLKNCRLLNQFALLLSQSRTV